jgi:hypothetical protein
MGLGISRGIVGTGIWGRDRSTKRPRSAYLGLFVCLSHLVLMTGFLIIVLIIAVLGAGSIVMKRIDKP